MKKKILLLLSIIIVIILISIIAGVIIFNRSIINVKLPHRAVLHVLPASKGNHAHCAIIICPGGGYRYLERWSEGYMWFPYFHLRGYTVAMLEYKMPKLDHQSPMTDAADAIRLMRQRAAEWNYDVNSVGIMGFSAGGHVASTLIVSNDSTSRPDFGILFYPVVSMKKELTHKGTHDHLLGENASEQLENQYSNDLHVSDHTPPVYIAVASNDVKVNPENSLRFYDAMCAKDRPVTLHVYPSFVHGWGYQLTFDHHGKMLEDLAEWLNKRHQLDTLNIKYE